MKGIERDYPPGNEQISCTFCHFWVDDFPFAQGGFPSPAWASPRVQVVPMPAVGGVFSFESSIRLNNSIIKSCELIFVETLQDETMWNSRFVFGWHGENPILPMANSGNSLRSEIPFRWICLPPALGSVSAYWARRELGPQQLPAVGENGGLTFCYCIYPVILRILGF